MQIACKGKKLNSCFKIKDTANFKQKHDPIYHGKSPANNYSNDYVGETGQRIPERLMDHNDSDVNSHLLKHHMEKSINVSKINTSLLLAAVFRIMQ